jgi:mannose-1-phosphate guanylyltransferase
MSIDSHSYAVIMAGGGGTRLWPLSRQSSPKQMLDLFGGKTLYKIAIDRLTGLFAADHIFIVTVANQVNALRKITPEIPKANFLIEPMPRGTASVVALAAAEIQKLDPDGIIAILTADHFIENIKGFQKLLSSAFSLARTGALVTLGIQPTYPATGYGYIEIQNALKTKNAFTVKRFVEKPSEPKAIEFLKDKGYFWNSGMFIWKVDVILDEFRTYMPDLFQKIKLISPFLGTSHTSRKFTEIWESIIPETIDYGIMEKSTKVVVLTTSDLGWNDVGSWDSLFDVLKPNADGNIVLDARHVSFDTQQTLVYSSSENKLIVTLGITNTIIIETPDALLICPRGESQRVKDLVKFLRENHYTPFL